MTQRFVTTRWSLVLAAGEQRDPAARAALDELCRDYWFPIYAFARRRGYAEEPAKDLTQGFFAQLIQNNSVARADAERGRFRTFLLACFKNFLANEYDKRQAAKRGGNAVHVDWDLTAAEERLQAASAATADPEQLYLQHWAQTVLAQAKRRVHDSYVDRGKQDIASTLLPMLTGGTAAIADAAATLNISEGAARVALHRLRRRFGASLREIVAETVAQPGDVDEEIRELLELVRGGR